ncbi:hypothetical protein [Escherichia coli]|uniref:hypothetical protein n=1 Tax=Escherichia coli TaxID=562 RepID=UPI0032B3C783
MTSLKTSIKTITYLSDIGCLEIQGASLAGYNRLCDENIDNFDFLNTPEKTLILDGVRLCEKKMTSKVIRLIKQARKYHKRLVVVADSCESEFIELLFDGVIALSFNSDRERSCNVYTPSRHRNTDNIYAR